MDIIDIVRKAKADDKKTLLIYNPLKVDFQGKWDGQELPEYLIPSKENKGFKTSLAKHFGKHIVDLYVAHKSGKKGNYSRTKAEKLVFPND